jgi:hypothetical protein
MSASRNFLLARRQFTTTTQQTQKTLVCFCYVYVHLFHSICIVAGFHDGIRTMAMNKLSQSRSNDVQKVMSVVVRPTKPTNIAQQRPNYGLIGGSNLRPTELLSNIVRATSLLDPRTMPLANLVQNVCMVSEAFSFPFHLLNRAKLLVTFKTQGSRNSSVPFCMAVGQQ